MTNTNASKPPISIFGNLDNERIPKQIQLTDFIFSVNSKFLANFLSRVSSWNVKKITRMHGFMQGCLEIEIFYGEPQNDILTATWENTIAKKPNKFYFKIWLFFVQMLSWYCMYAKKPNRMASHRVVRIRNLLWRVSKYQSVEHVYKIY